MGSEDLDPDIAFSFLLRTPQDLENLIRKIQQSKEQFSADFIGVR